MNKFYSNGKLLLTGEYVVLDGATSLAVPTKYGQDLVIQPIEEPVLVWGSFTNEGNCWFEAQFGLPKLRLTSASFNSDNEGSSETIAETLQTILQEARKLNPNFLQIEKGFIVKTNLTFPQDWGLGSSSTLINNIATWANVNPFDLLWNAFSGSGYDIACAKYNSPIFYTLKDSKPIISEVNFSPTFIDNLFFVYLNQKQNSREGIKRYREKKQHIEKEIQRISDLSKEMVLATSLSDFENIVEEHENIIASIVELPKVKEQLFSDYFGQVKSLGAWGGDFVLATGNQDSLTYFKQKGYTTVIPYKNMIL
ncbi:mevalonate kinase [Tenacibaculum skagerrakense]|uniref:Mevalonate kinase n=1 Tax=Tenacibaculum skagerrakense TaxID=186571 RepID=A0A4V2SLJ8_9FLAO|nr:GYDIA family GHMP kinase [Tenacibaculum skagerrakense]TCP23716.1 mevalonate kinase [Tenacibaculum skagerrakense]